MSILCSLGADSKSDYNNFSYCNNTQKKKQNNLSMGGMLHSCLEFHLMFHDLVFLDSKEVILSILSHLFL